MKLSAKNNLNKEFDELFNMETIIDNFKMSLQPIKDWELCNELERAKVQIRDAKNKLMQFTYCRETYYCNKCKRRHPQTKPSVKQINFETSHKIYASSS
jgi:hypothetical protein